jgi:hypothetical protein
VLWSLTSGAAGEFLGTDDWDLHAGWEQRLSTRALTQVTRLRKLFSALRWWELVPDTGNRLVTAGRGTELATDEPHDVLENDYVTAARTPDGRLAVAYLPTRRTISWTARRWPPGPGSPGSTRPPAGAARCPCRRRSPRRAGTPPVATTGSSSWPAER